MDIDNELNGLFSLAATKDHIIAYGNGLFVFTKKGTVLFKNKHLKNIYKIALLSEDLIIADCCSLRKYIVISLKDGEELYRIDQPPADLLFPKLTVSDDGHFVYDFYYDGAYNVIKIDTQEAKSEIVTLEHGLNTISDMICDKDGNLCILQSQNERISDCEISVCGIRYEYFDPCLGVGSSYYWKAKWYSPYKGHSSCFFGSVEKIITGDSIHDISKPNNEVFFKVDNAKKLDVTHLDTGEKLLFKNDPLWCKIIDKRYIQLYCCDSNIIVDRVQNKIVARYFSQTAGCIVDDEFWICSAEGLLRKKFPLIESEALRPKSRLTWN